MTKLQYLCEENYSIIIINKINKASIMGLTMKRKFQLLTWSNSRLEKVLKAIKQQQNKRGQIWIK